MAGEIREALLYDFNYSFFVANTMLPNVRNVEERQNVFKWLRFLKTSAKTLQELKLRNEFMNHLVKGVRAGVLSAPFDNPPSNIPLMSMISMLPPVDFDDEDPTVCRGSPRNSAIMQRSPDAGDFLAAQPIPDVGAFCYVAVLTKKNN
ncbi:uncharacterized protein LOC107042054 [Diachasma alloeum]|uniref:uncharacterized protein LOC107042054 n=1 Tax=Diachasma alloeum TaxID=454923 RepID=UPI000738112D|nr:uncharacterized protein LOC107042054 [Diachasma alloeum]